MSARSPRERRAAIQASGLDIYSPIPIGSALWIPSEQLEQALQEALVGVSLAGLPLRTRSKRVKELACTALGYPTPSSFRRVRPRFPGQDFDIYTQKANNLQVWNDELSPTRRYAIIQIDQADSIAKVRVASGQQLALLDTTGTLTTKYQARFDVGERPLELVVGVDTANLLPHVRQRCQFDHGVLPSSEPESGMLLPIADVHQRLATLLGQSFRDPGSVSERSRGAVIHELVCRRLGYASYSDSGQFPDVRHQLLEVKLQTSPTVDLGLVLPNSNSPIDVARLGNYQPRHSDTRYALFCGQIAFGSVTITHLLTTTGEAFFPRMRRFEGRVLNAKLQIPLPRSFFSD